MQAKQDGAFVLVHLSLKLNFQMGSLKCQEETLKMHIPHSALKIGSLRLSGFRHFSEEFDRNLSNASVRSF